MDGTHESKSVLPDSGYETGLIVGGERHVEVRGGCDWTRRCLSEV